MSETTELKDDGNRRDMYDVKMGDEVELIFSRGQSPDGTVTFISDEMIYVEREQKIIAGCVLPRLISQVRWRDVIRVYKLVMP